MKVQDASRAYSLPEAVPPTVRYWVDVLLTREASALRPAPHWLTPAGVAAGFAALDSQARAAMVRAAAACLDAHRLQSALSELESLPVAQCVQGEGDICAPVVLRGTRTLEWGAQDMNPCPYIEACWMLTEDADALSGVALALHDLSWSEKHGWRRGLAILGARSQVDTIIQAMPRRFPEAAIDRSVVRRPEDWWVSAICHGGRCWTRSADGLSSGWYRWPLRTAKARRR